MGLPDSSESRRKKVLFLGLLSLRLRWLLLAFGSIRFWRGQLVLLAVLDSFAGRMLRALTRSFLFGDLSTSETL